MRAHNAHFPGNWSEPYIISNSVPSSSVRMTVSTAVASPTVETLTTTVESEYIIIPAAVGGFLLLCLFFTVVTCLVVVGWRRRKFRKQFEVSNNVCETNLEKMEGNESISEQKEV